MSNVGTLQRRRALLSAAGVTVAAFATSVAKRAVACTPPAPITATITVANVADYATPQLAVDAIECNGGILYFPEGNHIIDTPIELASNIWVLGAGSATILTRTDTASAIFLIDDLTGVRISNMTLDVNAFDLNGVSGIAISGSPGSSDISIEQCVIYTGNGIDTGNYAYAIVATNLVRSRIRENIVLGLPIVCNGDIGPAVDFSSNHSIGSPSFGIGITSEDDILQIIIQGNFIESPGKAGILVGTSSEVVLAESISSVIIRDNIITGALPGPGVGIGVRPAANTLDVHIKGNIITNTEETVASNSSGIQCVAGAAGSSVRGLKIQNNSIRSVDQGGIVLTASSVGAAITGNTVTDTRGVQLISVEDGIEETLITDNIITDCALQGILLDGTNKSIVGAMICGNHISNGTGYANAAIKMLVDEDQTVQAEVRNNRCIDNQDSPTQIYGVIETASSNGAFETRYLGNDFTGNLYPANYVAAATILEDNIAAPTDARGIATITSMASTTTVNPGFAYYVELEDVSLTLKSPPASWTSGNVGKLWLTQPSSPSSTFTINCDPAPGSGESVEVYWRATVRRA